MHTTMSLHAAGWRSVYHDREVAVGVAPDAAAAFLVQRLRWAPACPSDQRPDPPWSPRAPGDQTTRE